MSEDVKLVQTKGNFIIKGIIEGKDTPAINNGYKDGVIEKGKSAGSKYRSIRFKVRTSKDNIIPIEIFGMERQYAYFYNKEEKKTAKVEWSKRFAQPKDGYKLIVPEYDLVQNIEEKFKDGDTVRVIGEFQPQQYEQNGIQKQTVKYIIKQIFKSKDEIDINANDFVEVNSFEQEAVINDIEVDNDNNKIFINTYIIGYGENYNPLTFELDTTTAHPLFIKTVKTFKFGDFIKLLGTIHYRAIKEMVDGEFGKQEIVDIKKSLEVVGVDGATFEKGMYSEDDFAKEEIGINLEEKINEVASNSSLPFNLD
ncbi:MAG: hypothetical protein ACM3O3_12410 [Syntrophothermus sp.]